MISSINGELEKNSTSAKKSKRTILVLDGIRAIACIIVISYHVHYILAQSYDLSSEFGKVGSAILLSGWSGVTLFFLLSGFLLFMPYAQSLLFQNAWPSLKNFYIKRAWRILPGYYVSLLLLVFFEHREYLQWQNLPKLGLFLTFLMDAPATYQQINGPFWTLAVEVQYYLLLPLIALLFCWLVRGGKTVQGRLLRTNFCLCGMVGWGLGTRYIGHYAQAHAGSTIFFNQQVQNGILWLIYGQSGKYLEDFAVGMLICTLYVYAQYEGKKSFQGLRSLLQRVAIWLWLIGIAILLFMSIWFLFPRLAFLVQVIGPHSWLSELGFAIGYGLCITALLFHEGILKDIFEQKHLCQIGHISYSLYIWHLPFLLLFAELLVDHMRHSFFLAYLLYGFCVLCLILPFGACFYRIVEFPGIRRAKKYRTQDLKQGIPIALPPSSVVDEDGAR